VIAVEELSILKEMTLGELEAGLCAISKPLLLKVLREFDLGIPAATPQDHHLATYAPKIEPSEGEICWSDPAEKIHNLIRAFSPRPGAWSWIDGKTKKMKILRAHLVKDRFGTPGEVLSKEGLVACGEGALQIIEVQPEGKKIMTWGNWLRGVPSFSNFSQ
jgi:methionyl-tRNA formyltransferase